MTREASSLAVYPELVLESANRYRSHLEQRLGDFSPPLRPAIETLIDLLSRVDHQGIRADQIRFDALSLARAEVPSDLDLLINQWCLGWGRDDAPVIVMGTEEAYPVSPIDLGLWNCCCAVIWAMSGSREIIERIDPRAADPDPPIAGFEDRQEFHVHANDYYVVHKRHWDPERNRWVRPGRHTWKLLAEAIAGRGHWMPLLEQNRGTLGESAYQIEVSAYPAKLAIDGRASSEERRLFLTNALTTMRQTAKVLLFHGRPNEPRWGGRDVLIGAFLRAAPPSHLDWTRRDVERQPVLHIRHNGRLVLLTRALNGSVSGALLDRLHELIAPEIRFRTQEE